MDENIGRPKTFTRDLMPITANTSIASPFIRTHLTRIDHFNLHAVENLDLIHQEELRSLLLER